MELEVGLLPKCATEELDSILRQIEADVDSPRSQKVKANEKGRPEPKPRPAQAP